MSAASHRMNTLQDISEARNNSITLVRLLASLAVIYGHSYAVAGSGGSDWVMRITGFAHAGGVAVDLFFLMSGFLVTASILKRGVFVYARSRMLRLFPALWVYLGITTLVIGPWVSSLSVFDYFSNGQTWAYLYHLGFGLTTEWFLPGVFEELKNKGVNGSIWSVIVEIRMYIIVAVVYLSGCLTNRSLFNVLALLVVVGVWSGLLEVPGVKGETDNHVALLFLIGAFLYVNRGSVVVSPIYFIFALAVAGMTHGTPKFVYGYNLVLICVFIFLVFRSFGAFMDRLGDYSYGVYLWGWPVQQLVMLLFPQATPGVNAFVSSVVALTIGVASWHLVEKPCLALKDRSFERWRGWRKVGVSSASARPAE
ncbi:Peptidoglycan/LPS O-acetylase OafA/YrhL, contains acyltransferase and SGNH-hydrolase domains [Aromatoleum tolulyticum]|uniref:Peptidoglycan/LPS O-acetylase OafA/YrhL, contains acyltransferase and SGNH-hydrolase domains n=2 Tax=Aromatoleum tolulyticum TaxID=34027 RepID=A0A1N6UUE3_9RHOO|nr:Peptidoglycan/LPS O-acetylase OafA/YrhL, contains acyltransferase and SGNH-hydrolase domains [Aromatoleum tolulyticum]